jgi:hypothetical protein
MGLNPRPLADAKILATINETLAREDLTSLRARVATKITHSQSTAKKLFDSHRKSSSFNPNVLVMVRKTTFAATGQPTKLLPKFKCPYRIVAVLLNDRYFVQDPLKVEAHRKWKTIEMPTPLRVEAHRKWKTIEIQIPLKAEAHRKWTIKTQIPPLVEGHSTWRTVETRNPLLVEAHSRWRLGYRYNPQVRSPSRMEAS